MRALLLLSTLLLGACGFETTRSEHAVTLVDTGSPTPDVLRVNVGDTVVWHNEGLRPRVVLFSPELARNVPQEGLPGSVREEDVPDVTGWSSGSLYQGQAFSQVLTEPGAYVFVPAFVGQAGALLDASDVNLSGMDLPVVGVVLVGDVELAAPEESPSAQEGQAEPEGAEQAGQPPSDEAAEQEQEGQPEFAVSGEQVYQANCASCHGNQGGGGVGPALAGNEELQDAGYVVRQILRGGGGMPAFAGQLSDEEIAAVATHIRTNWGNDYGRVSVQRVRELREAEQE